MDTVLQIFSCIFVLDQKYFPRNSFHIVLDIDRICLVICKQKDEKM